MSQHTSVGIKYLRLRHEAHIFAIFNHRQIPCTRVIEFLHNRIHTLAHFHTCRWNRHKLIDKHAFI